MNIIDKTKEVANYVRPCAKRDLNHLKKLVVHRFGPKENGVNIYHAEDVAAFFKNTPEYTGGKMAYHFLVTEDGTIERMLHDEENGMHARSYNAESIAVAVLGDFRYTEPTADQYRALVELLVSLCQKYKFMTAQIYGHDELPGGTGDPNKKCPGKKLVMGTLRNKVQEGLNHAIGS